MFPANIKLNPEVVEQYRIYVREISKIADPNEPPARGVYPPLEGLVILERVERTGIINSENEEILVKGAIWAYQVKIDYLRKKEA